MGLHGITVEEEFGGLGLGYLEHVGGDGGNLPRLGVHVGLSYGARSNLCINQIRRWASPEQKRRYLPKLISGEHVELARHVGGGLGLRCGVDAAESREARR